MSKNAHTGGEHAAYETDGQFITPKGKPGDPIAKTLYRRRGPVDKDVERRANAALFAAAPKMLRALRRLQDEKLIHAISRPTLDVIDAAIAAATGGEG